MIDWHNITGHLAETWPAWVVTITLVVYLAGRFAVGTAGITAPLEEVYWASVLKLAA